MKKILSLVAILALIVGTVGVAYASDLNDGLTRQVFAQTKGRSVASDATVLLHVWFDGTPGTTGCGVGVSEDSVLELYEDVAATATYTVDTSSSTYNTIQEVVDYINNQAHWYAEVGPDGYGDFDISQNLLPANIASVGKYESDAVNVKLDCSTAKTLMCGVDKEKNRTSRIKSYTHKIAGTGPVVVKIYDGNSVVQRESIARGNYNGTYYGMPSSTPSRASPVTVLFSQADEKGISGNPYGNIVVVGTCDTTFGDLSDKTDDAYIDILYDRF